MLEFIIMFCVVIIFVRIFLNKFEDLKGKDIISVAVALSISLFLTIIQVLIDAVLKLFL